MRTPFVLSALLAGCAISDVGETDYRRADPYIPAATEAAQEGVRVFYPSLLQRRDINGERRLSRGAPVVVRLRSVYISDSDVPENLVSEFGVTASALGETSRAFSDGALNLEIAVVANAFEYGGGNGPQTDDFDFTSTGLRDARVVYFSDDVAAGQFLNFNNLVIYGPSMFNGAALGLTLGIVELDVEGERQRELLDRLASIGGQAFPAIAPVAGVLNTLGGALLTNGDPNDLMFRYDLVLDYDAPRATGPSALNRAALEEGNYVFIRDESRNRAIPWDQLVLDDNTAELWRCEGGARLSEASRAGEGCRRFVRDTYVVAQISRASAGAPSVQLQQAERSLATLDRSLRDGGRIDSEVGEQLDGIGARLEQRRAVARALDLVSAAQSAEEKGRSAERDAALIDLAAALSSTGDDALSDADDAAVARALRDWQLSVWSDAQPADATARLAIYAPAKVTEAAANPTVFAQTYRALRAR